MMIVGMRKVESGVPDQIPDERFFIIGQIRFSLKTVKIVPASADPPHRLAVTYMEHLQSHRLNDYPADGYGIRLIG